MRPTLFASVIRAHDINRVPVVMQAARRVFEEAAHHHAPSSLVQYDGGLDGGFILLSDVKGGLMSKIR